MNERRLDKFHEDVAAYLEEGEDVRAGVGGDRLVRPLGYFLLAGGLLALWIAVGTSKAWFVVLPLVALQQSLRGATERIVAVTNRNVYGFKRSSWSFWKASAVAEKYALGTVTVTYEAGGSLAPGRSSWWDAPVRLLGPRRRCACYGKRRGGGRSRARLLSQRSLRGGPQHHDARPW